MLNVSTQKNALIAFILHFCAISALFFIAPYAEAKSEDFSTMSTQEKKARFRALVVPAVNHVYTQLMQQYIQVKQQIEADESTPQIQRLKKEYRVKSDAALLMAIKPHPKSIAIAQAALESAWGTSRFFNQANNVFGIWSFKEGEPRIAALKKRNGKTVWLRKYASIEEAVYDYYRAMGRKKPFASFREAKMQTNNPYELVKKLDTYSERGSEYGDSLAAMIRYNKFYEYDYE